MTNDAYDFNGSGQYVSYPQNTLSGEVTISFSVIWRSLNNWGRILDFGTNTLGQSHIYFGNRESSNDFYFQVMENYVLYGKTLVNEININEDWNHYVAVIKQNDMVIYKNGIVQNSSFVEQQISNGVPLFSRTNNYSGRSNWSLDDYFNGKIDELVVYNYQATNEQIECIFDVCNINKCTQCKDYSNVCGTCLGNRIIPNCDCPVGTVQNSTEDTCPQCQHQCLSCSNNNSNCDSCRGNRINDPTCECPTSYYDDGSSENCINCSFEGCKTCDNSQCITCLGSVGQSSSRETNECTCPIGYFSDIANNVLNVECLQCTCPQGYFSDIPNNISNIECQICQHQCLSCSNSNSNCNSCRGNRINDPTCECPNNFYDDSISENCLQCDFEGCLTCNNAQCISCFGSSGQNSSRIQNNGCICPVGYYSDISNNVYECQKCDFKCSECINSSDNCTVCKGDRVIDNSCACPYHKYDDNSSINCIECDNLCEECNLNGCQVCRYNRIPDTTVGQEQTCLCESSDIDHFSTLGSYWCTSCTTAVITPKFSNDYKTIFVQFYDTISIKGYINDGTQIQGSNGICKHILDTNLLDKLGQNCKCRIDLAQKQIIIYLGQQPTIINDVDQIYFKQDVIQRNGCDTDNKFINNYYQNQLLNADNPLPPSAEAVLPTGKVTLCQQITVYLTNIINDGLRGLNSIQWQIQQNSLSTLKLDTLLLEQNNNNQQDTFLIIPMLTLDSYKIYNFQVQYLNFAGQIGITQFTIETLSTKGTLAKIQQNQPFIFNIWKQNEIEADVNFQDCSSGELQFIDSPLKIDWVDITTDANNQVSLQSYFTEPTQKNIEYVIEKYSLVAGITYKILLKVNIENEPLMESTHFVEYLIEASPLTVYIEGGNRLHAYASQLNLQGEALDPDLRPEIQKNGISINWDCVNMMDQQACKNIGGELITLSNELLLTFQKKLFEPYNSFKFTLNGDNGEKQNQDISIIIVIETDLPVLTVSIPQQVRNSKINKNDSLEMEITSSQDPDEAFYSLIIIYKFEVVATKSYYYNKFAFQIWDIFNDFDYDDNEFLLRVSVYDPQFFMPSQASFQALINYEPLTGDIIITPTQGIALDTKFTIQCENFYDEDQPLTYKYSYYTNSQDYQTEIQQGGKQIQVFKNLIQDFTIKNSIQTILPSGYQDNLLLLVSVSDALGAVRNVTQSINIQKMSENNYIDNLNNLKNIYNLNKDKETSIKLSQINLMVQELGSIFLNNEGNGYEIIQDSSIEQQYIQFKKEVYDDLMSYVGNINSKVLEDQVMKSINILQNVGGNLVKIQGSDEIDQQIQQVDQIIKNQKEILKQMVQDNLLNQGDNKITKKQNNINEILGKSMSFMDKMSKNINDEVRRRRFLTEQDIQQQQSTFQTSKNIKSAIQQSMLPNSDQISFSGENISQEVQVITSKQLQQKYFDQNQSGLQILEKNDDVNNSDTQPGIVYKSSGTGFKINPFQQDQGFPYKNQNTSIQDIDINLEGQSEDDELQINNQLISMSFKKSTNSDNNNKCIQKEQKQVDEKWDFINCLTEEKTDSEFIQCNCKKLTPVTVVNDINNIFTNSQVDQVFGNEGFDALAGFNFWETIIFYVYILKLIGIMIFVRVGKKKDQEDINHHKQKIKELENIQNIQIDDMDEKILENDGIRKKNVKSYNIQQNNTKDLIMLQNKVSDLNVEEIKQENKFKDQEQFQQQNCSPQLLNPKAIKVKRKRNIKRNQKNKIFFDTSDDQNIIEDDLQSNLEVQSNLNDHSNNQDNSMQEKIQQGDEKFDQQQQQNHDIQNVDKTIQDDQINIKKQQDIQEDDQLFIKKNQNLKKKQKLKKSRQFKNLSIENTPKSNLDLTDFEDNYNEIQSGRSEQNNINNEKFAINNMKNSIQLEQLKSSNEGIDQKKTLNSKQLSQQKLQKLKSQSLKQYQELQIKKKASEALYGFHSFFGIYLIYKEDLSRPSRYLIYFIRINMLIAITALFSQQMTQLQSLLFSVLASIMLSIPCAIIQKLLKKKNIILQIIGIILSISFFVISLYIVLVTSALMGVDKANEWSISYLSSFCIDTFMYEPISGFVKVIILKSKIKSIKPFITKLIGDKSIINYLTGKD